MSESRAALDLHLAMDYAAAFNREVVGLLREKPVIHFLEPVPVTAADR
jgi:quinol monooxygenase YgiN